MLEQSDTSDATGDQHPTGDQHSTGTQHSTSSQHSTGSQHSTVSQLVVGFDLDMTLVDSADGIAATVRRTLAEIGRDVTPDQVWAYNGVPMEDTMRGLVPGSDEVALTARYRELYPSVGVPLTRLLPGARAAVDAVHGLGGRVIVVSTKVEPAVRLVVAQVGLVVDGVSGGLFAQAKAGALRAAGAAVFVGDHPGDVAAALAAGATAVGVATGPHSADDLRAAGADVVLPDLTGFGDWLRGYRNSPAPVTSARADASRG